MSVDKIILIDSDGVLTDGTLTIDHNGEKLFKTFHTRDVRAIRELVFNGWQVVIVTADDWPGINHFAEKVGAEVLFTRDKSKLPFEHFIAVGDDAWDRPMLAKASKAFIPEDADKCLFSLRADIVHLKTRGGRGVMAEVVRHLIL